MRAVIAGGGVAGLEAALALDELARDHVEVELLEPREHFVYRPMLVAEPFGVASRTEIDLDAILEGTAISRRRDALAAVEPGARTVTTAAGETLAYDALVLALGAQPEAAVPGAVTFGDPAQRDRFDAILAALGRRSLRRLAFVVPRAATWSIAAYELALLTAAERDSRAIPTLELVLVTAEEAPLALFGEHGSEAVGARLEAAAVEVRTGAIAEEFADGRLRLASGEALPFDAVVALPRLAVAPVEGLPQNHAGFVPTDVAMHAAGLDHVWVAGDMSSFPIKQGGLAAQQADVAARAIAARAGAQVTPRHFEPMLRAALITGAAPEFLAARVGDRESGAARLTPAWSPVLKLAADHLGPHLARALGTAAPPAELTPVEEGGAGEAAANGAAIDLLLAAADADALDGRPADALAWLDLVESLNLTIPAAYVARREAWRRLTRPEQEPSATATRFDPSLSGAEAALSDLARRVGWLREIEAGTGAEMQAHLERLDRGLEELRTLTRRTGSLG